MDPQQLPANQPSTPTPTPSVSPQPTQTPTVVQTPTPVVPAYSAQMAGGNSPNMKILFGVIVAVVVFVAALLVAWFMYLSPAAQSKRVSNSFMHSITTGDVAKATDLTGDSTSKDFLTTSSGSVHGSYTLSQSKFTGGKGYYLYSLSGANKKYARTTVDKVSGKRVVNSFVYSNTALALVPSSASSSITSSSSTSNTAKSTAAGDTTGCLTAADFSPFSDVFNGTPSDNGDGTFSEFFQLQFNPDVATYAAGDVPDPTAVFNDFKTFYAQAANKKYVIELESSVNSATPDEQLANARNSKVQSDLETISGIPASKITLQPITNDTSRNAGDAFYRQVQITLRSADVCSSLN